MHKLLDEPILLIKDAWGGKSLMVDFRPPSAGELADEKAKEKAGSYYKLLIEHVKEVLADPKSVYPDYDPKEGYELAGFVWFQGFNDMVGSYPPADPAKGKKGAKDYSEYSRLLACFIRDVRKDLSAPKLPFVIGVLGVGGETAGENTDRLPQGHGRTGRDGRVQGQCRQRLHRQILARRSWMPSWPRSMPSRANSPHRQKELKERQKNGGEWKKDQAKLEAEMRAKIEKALTADELFLLDNGISNQGFHYYGSAKFFGQIGKAFAEAMVDLKKKE